MVPLVPRGRSRARLVENRPDHGQQRDAVVGDNCKQRVLFARRQCRQRANGAPHLPTLTRTAARRPSGREPHRGVKFVQDGLCEQAQLRPEIGVRPIHFGHTSGFGRNRTVNSHPRSCASTTMHLRSTDASRTRRRMPPAPMIKSSSTLPSDNADESTCGNSSRNRYTDSRPEPDSRSTIGRSGPGGGDPSRRRALSSSLTECLGPDRFAGQMRAPAPVARRRSSRRAYRGRPAAPRSARRTSRMRDVRASCGIRTNRLARVPG